MMGDGRKVMGYRGLQMGKGVLRLAVAIVLCRTAGAVGSISHHPLLITHSLSRITHDS